MTVDLTFIDETIARVGRAPDAVIPILQAMQDHYGYLPKEGLTRVCDLTDIPPATITGVSSFYDMFRHNPVGKHVLRVCHGTACHVTCSRSSKWLAWGVAPWLQWCVLAKPPPAT